MTGKTKKAKRRKGRSRAGKVIELPASVEDDLLFLAEEEGAQRRAGTVRASGGSRCAWIRKVERSGRRRYRESTSPDSRDVRRFSRLLRFHAAGIPGLRTARTPGQPQLWGVGKKRLGQPADRLPRQSGRAPVFSIIAFPRSRNPPACEHRADRGSLSCGVSAKERPSQPAQLLPQNA